MVNDFLPRMHEFFFAFVMGTRIGLIGTDFFIVWKSFAMFVKKMTTIPLA